MDADEHCVWIDEIELDVPSKADNRVTGDPSIRVMRARLVLLAGALPDDVSHLLR
jgi:hypothetical protein